MVAAEEELDALEVFKEAFDVAVGEGLAWGEFAFGGEDEAGFVLDAEAVLRDGGGFVVGVEISEQVGAGVKDAMEVVDGAFEEAGAKELEAVPDEGAVEGAALFGEGLDKEGFDAGGVALVFVEVAVAEAVFEGGEEVLGIETAAVLGHELDVGGIGAA